MTNDITFCSNTNCENTKCMRNQCNIIGNPEFISVANFDKTEECLKEPQAEYVNLRHHIGHNIVCVCYGKPNEEPVNVSIECETCNEVLYSVDRYQED